LVTKDAFERQDRLESALQKLKAISPGAEAFDVSLVINALQRTLEDLATITSGDEAPCYLAWSSWRAGNPHMTMKRYEEVLERNPQQICALIGLANLCRMSSEYPDIDCSIDQFPEPEPEHVLNYRLDSGMTLRGFDANMTDLRAGLPVLVNLYWHVNDTGMWDWTLSKGGQWATLEYGTYVLQTGLVENLFPDGAFEDMWGPAIALRATVPMYSMTEPHALVRGKYQYWYDTDSQSGQIELLADGSAELTNALSLDNALEGGYTGLVSFPMRDCGGRVYVLLAHITDNGQGHNGFALAWQSQLKQETEWTNIVPEASLPEWMPVVGVVQVPDEGDLCRIWLMNWSESGRTYFDNVLVFELPVFSREGK
jgi:hypothetical protein